ncbi:hypothetical protein CAter282_0856 [Collimonas arenae]|uniref:Uncharacterized protein n=1 Tax=Collimonas arenae TaxID=279058 RepID=A0A127PLY9_9BURK|nr:hypothetical protein CAter10_0929 [Collimonas arenae]AMP08656.1 hypothetical protein CAter282_0856 [Collimonas arenae]
MAEAGRRTGFITMLFDRLFELLDIVPDSSVLRYRQLRFS